MSEDPSLLARWSARKRGIAAEQANEAAQPAPSSAPDSEELEANRLAAEAVDLDSLDKDSDLSVFLREGVPEALRNLALQQVWRSNPVFANLDELVDYGEDFGRKDLIMETFKSAWQAGRGYLDEIEDEVADESNDAPEPTEEVIAKSEAAPLEKPPADAEIVPAEAQETPMAAAPVAGVAPQSQPAPQPARPRGRGSLRSRLGGQSSVG